jgi:hypothetical protein
MKLRIVATTQDPISKLIEGVRDYEVYRNSTSPEERFKDSSKWGWLWNGFSSLINSRESDKDLAIQAMRAWEDGMYQDSISLLQKLGLKK